MTSRDDNSLRWLLLNQVFRPDLCSEILRVADTQGFQQAAYIDGRPRENVKVTFLHKTKEKPIGPFFERVIGHAEIAAQHFDIEVYCDKLTEIQVAQYLPGDHYAPHQDHDSSLKNLEYDRKLSVFGSLSYGGQMGLEGEVLNVGLGDLLIFPSVMDHFAPVQGPGARYSFVAWVPGPPWR